MKSRKLNSRFFIYILIIIFNIFLFQVDAFAENSPPKKILVINSLSKGNTLRGFNTNNWNDQIISGLESKLKKDNINVDLNVEYMDSSVYHSAEHYNILYNLYKYKYKTVKFDAIIAISNDAVDFLDKYANDLFPNTPVLFCAIDQSRRTTLKNHILFTGLYKSEDYKDTINIALKLHPNTKHFFIISQRNIFYSSISDKLSSSSKVDFTYCTDTDINRVKEKIDKLSSNTVIFIGTQFINNQHDPISISNTTNTLFKNCPLPVYAIGYSYMNNGIVGGMLTHGIKLGENIGDMTIRILNGEKPSDIPAIVDNSHNYVFDYNQLNRFNINTQSLPKGSEIINMPSTTYKISKQAIIYFSIGFASILILIIIFLLVIIGKLKNTKKLLINSESLLKTIINSTPDIIYFNDPNGKILEINEPFLHLLNIKEKDYKLKTIDELISPSSITNNDSKAWESGNVYRTEETILDQRKNINKIYDIIRVPLFNEDKTPRGLVLIGRDITEHKANEKNKKIIAELRYYDKLKMEFFTNLSHELRTPVNVIFSALQVVENATKNNNNDKIDLHKLKKYPYIMKQNCYRLTRIINNFIDINKIDYGNFPLDLQNIDIINILESIVLSVADYVENKGLSIIFDTEVEESIVASDPNILERIILNLLSNAIKFTPAGGNITVNIYCPNDYVVISVKDTGIGIPIEKQEAIFEKFVQVDKSLSRNREGSGVGLSLVKSLVELLNGTINVISKPNEGTEFIIKLPNETLPYDKTSVSDYNLNKSNSEVIRIEFSDIYN
ncbi:ATP-binding protein [Inconstantimicrobium mannanitabidum]|uniref:Uncharacterized protein n=1 Tax=Inconstantimicrobium mannanitabidum TaxID=1604901 RepID=A0ACB5R9B2_9CLOT|nr:ATP-binding protein [Clostridium sp. TW13]GKX65695.1 hypothetical protein rsdtw13_09530 [Clostridium sp. TW13]